MHNPFDILNQPISQRMITGLAKICTALRSQAWQGAESQGLSPTQGRILALLQSETETGMRLSAIAAGLATTPATASDAVSSLVKKGLVSRDRAADDRRAISIRLTPEGLHQAKQAASWPDFLLDAVEALSPEEQTVFFKGLTTIIQTLQELNKIPVSKMCLTCHYFAPHVYDDPRRPHHCNLVNAPFGDRDLRLDCPEHLSAIDGSNPAS
ncbi:MarR family transcriptional regulator [filamentous cyanobacterium CCP5]|nr:MarR family transcriptional regulator [filamentous cyanobacterium CCP5]